VAEGSRLGKARGTRGVLDVDGVLRAEAALQGVQIWRRHEGAATCEHFCEGDGPRGGAAAERDHPPQARELGGGQAARLAAGQLGHGVGKDGEVIRGLEAVDQKQCGGVALCQHVSHFMLAISRIDRHQHGSDPRRGELQHHPFRYVGGPHGHVISTGQPQSQQPCCRLVHAAEKLGIGPTQVQCRKDQRILLPETSGRGGQCPPNGQAVHPGLRLGLRHGHLPSSDSSRTYWLPGDVPRPAGREAGTHTPAKLSHGQRARLEKCPQGDCAPLDKRKL